VSGGRNVVKSEWTKLSSLRSTKVLAGLAVALSLLATAALSIVIGETFHNWHAADRASFDPVDSATVGGIVTAILFLVLGVKAATAEYASGMIRVTLTATPRRWHVLAAKVAVVSAITAGAGLVSTVGMLLVAQGILGGYGLPAPHLGDTAAMNAIVAGSVIAPLFPLIGLTLGMALRSTAWGIIATLGFILAPDFVFALLPSSWSHAVQYFPSDASTAITNGGADALAPGFAAVVVLGWLALCVAGSIAVFERRDA